MRKKVSPDPTSASRILDSLWRFVLDNDVQNDDEDVDSLVDSNQVAIRYCLPTQILGKLTDSQLNCLCLQKGDGTDLSRWDPRGFASKVIVPWVQSNEAVLGTSRDPYVGKPLRKEFLTEATNHVKAKGEWGLLYAVLSNIEAKNDPDFTKHQMVNVLSSILRKLKQNRFDYAIPERVSLEQTLKLISSFLRESSGGDRGLAIAAAIFETIAVEFDYFSKIRRSVINASDKSTGQTADIECIGNDGQIKLVVEVKERNIELTDVKHAISSARRGSIHHFVFNAPGIRQDEESEIVRYFSQSWASGTNLYHLTIEELAKVVLTLVGDRGRTMFLRKVGEQLDEYNTQPLNRIRWKDHLDTL